MEVLGALDVGNKPGVLLNKEVAFDVLCTRDDDDCSICAAALDAIKTKACDTGCAVVVDGEGAPEVVDGILNDAVLEADGSGEALSAAINDKPY